MIYKRGAGPADAVKTSGPRTDYLVCPAGLETEPRREARLKNEQRIIYFNVGLAIGQSRFTVDPCFMMTVDLRPGAVMCKKGPRASLVPVPEGKGGSPI